MVTKVEDDLVKGCWYMLKDEKGVVWCDASGIIVETVPKLEGKIVEDALWLRKKE